jgi:hypothetical protein
MKKDEEDSLGAGWTDVMAMNVAMLLCTDGSPEDFMEHHGISREYYDWLLDNKLFMDRVTALKTDIMENGLDFKQKSRALAGDMLELAYGLAVNPSTSATVRADMAKSIVSWAGLGASKEQAVTSSGGMSVVINMDPNVRTQTPPPKVGKKDEIVVDISDGLAGIGVDRSD